MDVKTKDWQKDRQTEIKTESKRDRGREREHTFGNKLSVPKFGKKKLKLPVPFSKMGTGKLWCLVRYNTNSIKSLINFKANSFWYTNCDSKSVEIFFSKKHRFNVLQKFYFCRISQYMLKQFYFSRPRLFFTSPANTKIFHLIKYQQHKDQFNHVQTSFLNYQGLLPYNSNLISLFSFSSFKIENGSTILGPLTKGSQNLLLKISLAFYELVSFQNYNKMRRISQKRFGLS